MFVTYLAASLKATQPQPNINYVTFEIVHTAPSAFVHIAHVVDDFDISFSTPNYILSTLLIMRYMKFLFLQLMQFLN